MTTHLHIDAFSGVSGDMFLGALVDAGVPLSTLQQGLKSLRLKGYRLNQRQVMRNGIRATKIDVDIQKGLAKPLSLAAIRQTLRNSHLPDGIRAQALQTFKFLAEAEGAAHGQPPAKVHFHEVGVIDSLVDIVGTFLGVAHLNPSTISFSPINLGAGTISTSHGLLPVPGPAVAQLAQGIPVCSNGPALEFTTPTGIALIKTLSQTCRSLPPLTPHRIGYGAGTTDPKGWPNVLRIFMGSQEPDTFAQTDRIIQLETNLDDMNPQLFDSLTTRLFEAGALDVTLTPTLMKRHRPGIILQVLGPPRQLHTLTDLIFQETSTLGIRVAHVDRYVLPRSFRTIRVPGGTIRMKLGELGRGRSKASPEFRDCEQVAMRSGRPVREILELARQTFARTSGAPSPLRPKKSPRRSP